LILHGPVQVVLKGCRGIHVDAVGEERVQDDSLTMGFSANLEYSTDRTGDVIAYMTGKRPLMRARFRGSTGIYMYEETADPTKRKGVLGSIFDFSDKLVDVIIKFAGG